MKGEPVFRPVEVSVLVEGGTEGQEAELDKKIDAMRPGADVARQLEASRGGEGHAAVHACLLGLALFKSADRLGIEID